MALVQVDERHRLTLPKNVREKFRIVKGQKFYLVPSGDDLIMKTIPRDPAKKLDEILGDFTFDREAMRRSEKWLMKETKASHKKRSSL
ncbi:MAG TPA: AbrB/MazE/SpoVT family DNA-binding domain-containing protein [Nitrososphaerales archaeon]|nr:AbrB/MazE/SpoVT family DNA-binding domain-containing protein [Nitrososphaerales archaeon]